MANFWPGVTIIPLGVQSPGTAFPGLGVQAETLTVADIADGAGGGFVGEDGTLGATPGPAVNAMVLTKVLTPAS